MGGGPFTGLSKNFVWVSVAFRPLAAHTVNAYVWSPAIGEIAAYLCNGWAPHVVSGVIQQLEA